MSQMKELYNKVVKDEKLLRQTETILSGAAGHPQEAREKLFAFARELGYDVTEEEAAAFFEGMQMQGDLSDEELDLVAGGKNSPLIALSVLTVGLTCAFASIGLKIANDDCKGAFE